MYRFANSPNWKPLPFTEDDSIKFNESLLSKPIKKVFKYKDLNIYTQHDLIRIEFEDEMPIYLFKNINSSINSTKNMILEGTNTPIYNINVVERLFDRLDDEESIIERCKRYIHFFFSFVEGEHGSFDIFEDFEQLKDHLSVFYSQPENRKSKYDEKNYQSNLPTVKRLIDKSIIEFSNSGKFKIKTVEDENKNSENFQRICNCYMHFKGNIFNADVVIETNTEINNFGLVSLENPKLIELVPTEEINDHKHELQRFRVEFKEYKVTDILPPLHSWYK